MNRRTVLGGLGAGLVALAGCSGGQPADSAASPAGTPTTATPSEPPTTSPASASTGNGDRAVPESSPLRLLSTDAPKQAQIGQSVGYRFTLENPTADPQPFEPTVSVRTAGSAWARLDRWEAVEFAPGEIRTFTSSSVTSEYLTTHEVRIDGVGETFTIEFVERQLPFGETHTDPVDREVTAHGVSIRDNFEYTSDGYERIAEAGEDHQWVLLDVRVINRLNASIEAPPYDGFSLLDGDETYAPIPTDHDDAYAAIELPRNGVASGVVMFKVPDNLLSGDLQASWYEPFDAGDVGVVWSPR